ncbi:hypothetical protein [Stutzerimonas kunmingensis]|uniref:hypothetical protein n=1 Tax=Stutzerimonas kunmingensis TaxID=1211807 RepID=UPI0011B0D394|nr:hypothetical protein [Stutzerimonas kunmingensis]
MNYKELAIEFLQATSTIVVLAFLFAAIGSGTAKPPLNAITFALVFGGIPTMLAKRFILSFTRREQ